MDTKIIILLIGSALCSLMLPSQGQDDSPQLLSYLDVLKVFTELARPYQDWKIAQHAQVDLQVEDIISQIQAIIPALSTLHRLVHNLSSHLPLLASNFHDPLLKVKNNLNLILGHFNKCHQTLNTEPQTVNTEPQTVNTEPKTVNTEPQTANYESQTANSEYQAPNNTQSGESTSSSEQVQEHHQSSMELVEHDQYTDRIPSDVFGSQFLDLVTPVAIEDSRLSAILGNYAEYSVVFLNDTAKAFQAVANEFLQGHGHQFLTLGPQIREVMEKVSTIRQHVAMATAEVMDMSENADMLYRNTLGCVRELSKLTSDVRDLTDHIC